MTSRGEAELVELETVFAALAHASRRRILIVLNARGGAMTAGEIARRFSCTWPTTSRHLRTLEAAGLVTAERRGREVVYRLQREQLDRVVRGWIRWFNDNQDGGRHGH